MTRRIGFVVIGRNEARHLGRCLASVVAEAAGAPVVYVDSRSTDDSVAVARSIAGVQVLELDDPTPNAAKGRNAGWRHLEGAEVIQFVDGDTELASGWVAAGLAALAEPGVGAVYGRYRERHPEASVYNRMADLDWPHAAGAVDTFGGIVMVRRACLLEAGGFDPTLRTGEDPALAIEIRRRGHRILQLDTMMAWHDIDLRSFAAYWRRNVLCGWSMAEVDSRLRGVQPWWRRRAVRSCAGIALGVVVAALAILLHWSILVAGAVLAGLDLLRIALRNRARAGSLGLALLYALHVRVMAVPMVLGQCRWQRERHRR